MRKIFYLVFSLAYFFPLAAAAQNVGIGTQTATYRLTVKDSLGSGIGFAQVSPDGLTAVGTFVSNGNAYIQTHTNTDLKFATNDGAYQMVIQKATGNVGIGSVVPTQKLEVAGNAKINGTLQVMGGSPGANKVLTSDAVGNATWQAAAYSNAERFQFKMASVVSNGRPEGVLTTLYNLGTATAGIQGGSIYDEKYMSIVINKAGLYHFDWVLSSTATGVYTTALIPFSVYRSADEVYRYVGTYKDDPVSAYSLFDVSHQAGFDIYMPAPASIKFSVPFVSSSTSDKYQMTITGNLIAD